MARARIKRDQAPAAEDNHNGGITVGQRLRQAREAKGLSLEDVFDKTKLRPSIVEAIEQERWKELPAPAFVKGFLRTYVKLLEIDEREIIELYDTRVPKDNRPFEAILTKRQTRKTGWAVAIVIMIAVFAITYWWIKQPPPSISNHERAPVIEKQVSKEKSNEKVQFTMATGEKDKQVEKTEQSESLNTVPEAADQSDVVRLTEKPVSEQAEPQTEKTVAVVDTEPNLVLKALVKERTWMRIKTDGGQAKEYIFDPGSRPIWKAQKIFDIMIGNAAGIELELNGKPLGPLGKRGKVIHLVLPKDS